MTTVDLRGAESTLLATLLMRERDARAARPVLGDPFAGPALARVRHEAAALRWLASSDTVTICARARRLDDWTRSFLAAHPEGQVLHLGCGLDSRPLRLARPAGSRWIDVDRPTVIGLRREVYDLPDDVESVAASVGEAGWWAAVDTDRPTLAVAEGLFEYLPPAEVHTVIDRLVATCGRGELAFDGVAPWVLPVANAVPTIRSLQAWFRWAYGPASFAQHHPALRLLDDVTATALAAELAPTWWARAGYAAVDVVPLLRDAMRLLRFGFGPS